MKIKETIKESWKKFRLNHHYCERNLKLVDSFTSSVDTPTSSGSWQTSIYRCTICGKRFDVD
jgi:hypothetical protein